MEMESGQPVLRVVPIGIFPAVQHFPVARFPFGVAPVLWDIDQRDEFPFLHAGATFCPPHYACLMW